MSSADSVHRLSPQVRAAIGTFLNKSQRDPKPFAVSEAIRAIRRVFPDLELSDVELADAISSEALTAGRKIHYDVAERSESASLDRWEDEGGAQ